MSKIERLQKEVEELKGKYDDCAAALTEAMEELDLLHEQDHRRRQEETRLAASPVSPLTMIGRKGNDHT